jgi:hypothetical protein
MSKHLNPIEMINEQITIGSVHNTKTGKRMVFAVKGVFDTKKGLIGAIRRELDWAEQYDLRTVKYHDSMTFLSDRQQVMSLNCLYDDLLTPDKSCGVNTPVRPKAAK